MRAQECFGDEPAVKSEQSSLHRSRTIQTIGYAEKELGCGCRMAVAARLFARPQRSLRHSRPNRDALYHRCLANRRRTAAKLGDFDDSDAGRLPVVGDTQ